MTPVERSSPDPLNGNRQDVFVDVSIETEGWLPVLGEEACDQVASVVQIALGSGGLRRAAEVGVRLSDDETVRALNHAYRGHDAPTNVLSFALSEDDDPTAPSQQADEPPLLLGDLVLSLETVLEEAEGQEKAARDHAVHLLIHGALHLLGFDHHSEAEAERMECLEIQLCQRFGISDPYADPGPAVPYRGT